MMMLCSLESMMNLSLILPVSVPLLLQQSLINFVFLCYSDELGFHIVSVVSSRKLTMFYFMVLKLFAEVIFSKVVFVPI